MAPPGEARPSSSDRFTVGILDHNHRVETPKLAVAAQTLGYAFYWLAEHHTSSLAACPEILLPLVGALTKAPFRVGTAAVLLQYYSPLRVAEQYLALSQLFPDRIDLGLGRGGIVIERLAERVRLGSRPEKESFMRLFGEKAELLATFLRHLDDPEPELARECLELSASIRTDNAPDLWIHGSGGRSAELAAELGTPYGQALFFGSIGESRTAIDNYRQRFRPRSQHCPEPRVRLGVVGYCSDSRGDIDRVLATYHLVEPTPKNVIIGTVQECRSKFAALTEELGTREMAFRTLGEDLESKQRSLALLADALELREAVSQTA